MKKLFTSLLCLFLVVSINAQIPIITNLPSSIKLTCNDYDFYTLSYFPIYLEPMVANTDDVFWTTTGDGYFDDPTTVQIVYHLGFQDLQVGTFALTLVATNNFGDATAIVEVNLPSQLVLLYQGWQGISSYVDMNGVPVSEVMEPVKNELIAIIDEDGGLYYPATLLNTIGNWEPRGYKALFHSPCCLPLYDNTIIAPTFTVEGPWTYLPILSKNNLPISNLFYGFTNQINMLYDWQNSSIWTPNVGDFTTLVSGKTYLLKTKETNTNFTIDYPQGSSRNLTNTWLSKKNNNYSRNGDKKKIGLTVRLLIYRRMLLAFVDNIFLIFQER